MKIVDITEARTKRIKKIISEVKPEDFKYIMVIGQKNNDDLYMDWSANQFSNGQLLLILDAAKDWMLDK